MDANLTFESLPLIPGIGNVSAFRNDTNIMNIAAGYNEAWIFDWKINTAFLFLYVALNFPIILLFVLHPPFRSSFSFYVTVLAVCNIVQGVGNALVVLLYAIVKPFNIYVDALSVYVPEVLYMLPIQIHALISFSRLWALSFPIHYRLYHNMKLAGILCGATIVFTHLLTAPYILSNTLGIAIYGIDENYAPMLQIVVKDTPLTFLVLSYPMVLGLYCRRHQKKTELTKLKDTQMQKRRQTRKQVLQSTLQSP
ncbi:uncharacterized protein LOC129599330 [Paramacrobiotus metropolitanus]|uniref:uncharacterized protein LOC129599330 n=1 Tax=Paramacrobiotus metropolitanus TaxID=2943436 RepID=UPI00244582DE|nr:uncharacterized protein LOC129599330 [Paramacrobiotus metropolitanus]